MKRIVVALGAGILLPVVAAAAPVSVDVRVAGIDPHHPALG